jgi:hypothetical protein
MSATARVTRGSRARKSTIETLLRLISCIIKIVLSDEH